MRMPVLSTSISVGGPSTPIVARISSVIADSGAFCSATRCPLSSLVNSAHATSQGAAQVYLHSPSGARPAEVRCCEAHHQPEALSSPLQALERGGGEDADGPSL